MQTTPPYPRPDTTTEDSTSSDDTPSRSVTRGSSPNGTPPPPSQPTGTTFRWRVFSDATCAGLAVLIPLPLADLLLERYFRRRMPPAIATAHGADIPRERLAGLVPTQPLLSASSCLTLPLSVVVFLLKRLSKKLLYFLTIKEATDKLSAYWLRAHLIDHVVRAGHLDDPHDPQPTWTALEQVMSETDTSPLRQLARRAIRGSHHLLRALLQARRGQPSDAVRRETGILERHWDEVVTALTERVQRFETVRRQLEEQHATSQPGDSSAAPAGGATPTGTDR